MTRATHNGELAAALEAQRERLLPCVHCGFCLPACPTYNRLGDEADSPRGRLHLMGAVVEGRLSPASDAFRTHIDRCLGCRACEPVCPSGVEYGTLLELARDVGRRSAPQPPLARALLDVFASERSRRLFFLAGRVLRSSRLAALGARLIPGVRRLHGARFGLAMLASTVPWKPSRARGSGPRGHAPASATDAERPTRSGQPPTAGSAPAAPAPAAPGQEPSANGAPWNPTRRPRVGVLLGCVQEGLYARVNDATERVLRANGYDVVTVRGQGCCGALHAHGGVLDQARAMARANIEAFEYAAVEYVAVNAAGCGAAMKDYDALLERDEEWAARARRFAASVRDVTELLASVGPRPGAPLPSRVAYDHPCHLLHAQGVRQAPLDVLAAVPELEVRIVDGADECCGGAGIYGITHPELGSAIGADKVAAVRRAAADAVATPNPGCMMQIGAGLRLEGAREGVVHPVELLDESYRRAGYYDAE